MASILDLLSTQNGDRFIDLAVEETSEDKEQVITILAVLMPALLGTIKMNLRSRDGESNFGQLLKSEQFDEDFFKKLDHTKSLELSQQGEKILEQYLGQKKEDIISLVSRLLEVNESSVEAILKIATPMVIGLFANLAKNKKMRSEDPGELLDSLMGASGKFDPSLIDAFLTDKGDANIIKDAKGRTLGGGNKGKKDGGLLGGMVGGK